MPVQLPIYADDETFPANHYNPFVGVEYNSNKLQQDGNMFLKRLRHKFLYYISKPIFQIPLLNWLIIMSLSAALLKLTFHYHSLYTKSSIIATCLTNIVLFAISDTLAQSIASYKNKSPRLTLSDLESQYEDDMPPRARTSSASSIFVDYGEENIGMRDVVEVDDGAIKVKSNQHHMIFDFHRFFGFIAWGFFMAFIQVAWYMFLHSMYLELPSFVTVCARVITDQLCFSPVSLYAFFSYSTFVLEGGTRADLYEKVKNIYLSTLVANYAVWVPVQFINFLIMPRNLQVPFSSSIGVLWNCFLSMRNAAAASAN